MTAISTLSSAVQTRIGEQVAIELTNPRTPGASAVNATVLDAASADAIGRFAAETGAAFDSTAAAHLAIGIDLALFYLHARAGNFGDAERHFALAKPLIDALRSCSGIVARTNSRIDVADADRRGEHDFSRDSWAGYRDDTLAKPADDSAL